jgi:NAD(P)-dependent dehydrogenase (short-subunit alcohol dehydrogenase family)
MSLANKVVLITGAGSGIGADAARAFHNAGSLLVLNGRRPGPLERTAVELDPSGERVAIVAGDIGDPATSHDMVEVALKRFSGVDVLFNNAGIFAPKPFLETTSEELDAYLNLMRGYFFAAQAVIPAMQRRGGAIVNTGSMWANHAIAATPCSASSMAKGGVHALTRNLAIEFAPHKIRVNAIAPAVVETPLFEPLLSREELAAFNHFHPLGRNGQPRDITEAVLFLADDERSGWITGAVLPVDGGVTAGRN